MNIKLILKSISAIILSILLVATATASPSTSFFVGELGKAWRFPSDHLPIGITVNGLRFAHWNILDTNYLHYIENNSQGLKDSLIMELNRPSAKNSELTLREELVLEQVMSLIKNPTSPRSLLSLQETSATFLEVLKRELPKNLSLLTSFSNDIADGDIFIYDNEIFEFKDLYSQRYQCQPGNVMMALTLQERSTEQQYRIIQSHVPGGPVHSESARKEFTALIMECYDPNSITVILGDMNHPPQYFLEEFERHAAANSTKQPYRNIKIPYPTHINTHKEASWIDNIFYAAPEGTKIEVSRETHFSPEVQSMALLLRKISWHG